MAITSDFKMSYSIIYLLSKFKLQQILLNGTNILYSTLLELLYSVLLTMSIKCDQVLHLFSSSFWIPLFHQFCYVFFTNYFSSPIMTRFHYSGKRCLFLLSSFYMNIEKKINFITLEGIVSQVPSVDGIKGVIL